MSMVTDPPDQGRGMVSRETAKELLGSRLRRYSLYCLYLYANPVGLPDVADQVTEWVTGTPGEENLDERLRLYMELYHTHVPALADAGVVEYSQEEDLVELGENAPQLRPYLEQTIALDSDRIDDVSTLK